MLELILKTNKDNNEIALLKEGELIEYYIEEEKNEERNEGNIYYGIVNNIIEGMQSAFVDIGTSKNGFIHIKDVLPKINEKKVQKESVGDKNIKDYIKESQPILVQVKKDCNDRKGSKLSTHISLTSKYIVFMPNVDIITVSQKIEDKLESERLIKLVKENIDQKHGVVIRTSAIGKTEEIIEDIKNQTEQWNNIKAKYNELNDINKKEPMIIYKNESIIEKLMMDLLQDKINSIILNDKECYKELNVILKKYPELNKVKLIVKPLEEIEKIYNLKNQIEKINHRKIWLKSGGFITIDKTEALTAIDVNTGKYSGKSNLEDTVFNVNKEATIEIAKQIRLKDIGGIIVIDYIDMKKEENKKQIEELLRNEVKKDRSKVQVEGFSKLNLMEITRKHICSHK